MGAGQHSAEGVICYELGAVAVTRRARALAAVGAMVAIMPLVFAALLCRRAAFTPGGALSVAGALLLLLVLVRTVVHYAATKRRLRELRVVMDDHAISTRISSEGFAIPRSRVARIVEIQGSLGGLRIESQPEATDGTVVVASIPRGGDAYAQVRARLEGWHAIERPRRRGPLTRIVLGIAIVFAIFFLPFVLDDFVARSNLLAGLLVLAAWLLLHWALRS